MNQTQSGRPQGNGAASLEANLDICQAEIRKALARAEAIDPVADEYGHAANNAYGQAMRFLKMSAKLGLALAKVRSEHTSYINVRKIEAVEPPPEVRGQSGRQPLVRLPPDPAREAHINKIYADWVAANAAREARGEEDVDEDWEEDEVEENDREEGDPPPFSEGSNTEK